jgi:UDP-sugar transporter A1/2/3
MSSYSNYVKYLSDWVSYLGPKWLALIGFILQNTILIIFLRAAAIASRKTEEEYLPSTVVVFTELVKLVLSTIMAFYLDAGGQWDVFVECLSKGFVDNGLDVLKLCLPAILYAVQNNLQYVIESAPLFMVLYQSKLVTTAIFFTFMLSKRLSIKEWCAVILLSIGVSMVESSQHDILPHHASNVIGMISVAFACMTSGFAGVYYEKVLKTSNSSIWMLNIQLSMMSFSFCSVGLFFCLLYFLP